MGLLRRSSNPRIKQSCSSRQDDDTKYSQTVKKYSIDELAISCKGETYEVRVSFFRNLAVASYRSGERAAHLSGSLTGRSYEAVFAINDGCTFPIAIFLLWHLVTNRRRAYRVAPGETSRHSD